jgi:hypothetical protein
MGVRVGDLLRNNMLSCLTTLLGMAPGLTRADGQSGEEAKYVASSPLCRLRVRADVE